MYKKGTFLNPYLVKVLLSMAINCPVEFHSSSVPWFYMHRIKPTGPKFANCTGVSGNILHIFWWERFFFFIRWKIENKFSIPADDYCICLLQKRFLTHLVVIFFIKKKIDLKNDGASCLDFLFWLSKFYFFHNSEKSFTFSGPCAYQQNSSRSKISWYQVKTEIKYIGRGLKCQKRIEKANCWRQAVGKNGVRVMGRDFFYIFHIFLKKNF